MLGSAKAFFVILVLDVSLVGSATSACPVGDLNGDCQVGLPDLQAFAAQWLAGQCSGPTCADLDDTNDVNMVDFAELAESWRQAASPVVINEFMAVNSSTTCDPQSEFDDWVELYNCAGVTVDVSGMYLTDDMDEPTKWRIPDGFTIDPDSYLLIWTDGDSNDYPGLHAGFRLRASGEQVYLFDADGHTLLDSITFDAQTADISFGRYPDGAAHWCFFGLPSPAAQNSSAYLGEVADPEFSRPRGFYDGPFAVTIATETDGAAIYYTFDGTEPGYTGGRLPNGIIYTGPVPISRTTVLRATAMKPGHKPSSIVTHTYFLHTSNATKSLPAVSLVGDPVSTYTELYASALGRGRAYEFPTSFEIIYPQDNFGIQQDCGIRLHGSSWMRRQLGDNNPQAKWSHKLFFRAEYDSEGWLNYPIIPFAGVDRYKNFVLRAGQTDRTNPFIKDELARRLHRDMGHEISAGTFVNLFINGQLKNNGYYNPCERHDETMFQEHYSSDLPWDVVSKWQGPTGQTADPPRQHDEPYKFCVRDGDHVCFAEMLHYAQDHDLTETAHYQELRNRLDMADYIDYLILQGYTHVDDWPQNNWNAARERSSGSLAKWRFCAWDLEHGFKSGNLTRSFKFPAGNSDLPISILNYALRNNREFKLLFADRVQKHFFNGGALTAGNVTRRFDELRNIMNEAILNQNGTAMDTYIRDIWAPQRPSHVLADLVSRGLFTFEGPRFKINDTYQHGGCANVGDILTITEAPATQGTIYYTTDGNDPRQPADPRPTSSTTLVAENADKRAFVPTSDIGAAWIDLGCDDLSWFGCTGSPGGVGYEAGSGNYDNYISLDVKRQMYDISGTCYIRIPFVFDGNPANFDFMALKVRYDDGFIAYLNGQEIAKSDSAPAWPRWNSEASTTHSDSSAIILQSFDVSARLNVLQAGDNLLAIHGLNKGATSSDFLICVELVAGTGGGSGGAISSSAIEYTSPVTLDKSYHIKARVRSGVTWSALNEATFSGGPVVDNLRITEIMYHPQDTNDPHDPNEEFIELVNIGPEEINLNLVSFSNGINYTFGSVDLTAGQHIVVVKDQTAFAARYDTARMNIAPGQYAGSLANNGERIRLEDAIARTILDFEYSDGWRRITDGDGFSLTIVDPTADPGTWAKKDSWRASAYVGGSPGTDDSGILPNPGAVVINEVLSHSHLGPDWIELYNTTDSAIDIGGWYLSDNDSNLMKYRISDGTVIGANDYRVFYEHLHFGSAGSDPGRVVPFALSENGEVVTLSSAEGDELTGYRQMEDFGASESDVSFGRYYKSNTKNFNFVAMHHTTEGAANAEPKVGPIVINEIMYHPAWPEGGSYTNDDYEYVELYNVSDSPVTLYDYLKGMPWKFTDGIDFGFPVYPNEVTIAPGDYLLIVKKPAAFFWRYPDVAVDKVLGPYDGRLSNSGEKLELAKPGDVDKQNIRCYIRVDRISYSDGSHPQNCPGGIDLWPRQADGLGKSLWRIVPIEYGNDVGNWTTGVPSPGQRIAGPER